MYDVGAQMRTVHVTFNWWMCVLLTRNLLRALRGVSAVVLVLIHFMSSFLIRVRLTKQIEEYHVSYVVATALVYEIFALLRC